MVQTSFSDHSGIKVEIENRKIFAECRKYGKIKNHIFKHKAMNFKMGTVKH